MKKKKKILKKKIIDDIKNEKIKDNKNEDNESKKSYFYEYDPNEEDKNIGKFSANIIDPEEINEILGKNFKK